MNLFRDINARGTTVVVATHDRELIRRVGRRDDRPRPRPPGGDLVGDHDGTLDHLLFRRSAASLWRQRGSVLLSMLTIASALLVLGGFLVVTVNLDRAVSSWSAAAEFSIYLADDITQEQRVALNTLLDATPPSRPASTSPRPTRRCAFRRDFPDLAAGLAELPENPLPASIDVRLNPAKADGVRSRRSPAS